jgi:hypothetical protein
MQLACSDGANKVHFKERVQLPSSHPLSVPNKRKSRKPPPSGFQILPPLPKCNSHTTCGRSFYTANDSYGHLPLPSWPVGPVIPFLKPAALCPGQPLLQRPLVLNKVHVLTTFSVGVHGSHVLSREPAALGQCSGLSSVITTQSVRSRWRIVSNCPCGTIARVYFADNDGTHIHYRSMYFCVPSYDAGSTVSWSTGACF